MPRAEFTVLAINPGSTSTKIAVFSAPALQSRTAELQPAFSSNVLHPAEAMQAFRGMPALAQISFREAAIAQELISVGFQRSDFSAVVGRGGLLRPLPSGVYRVNDEMLEELRRAPYGEHASNMGAFLAQGIATRIGCDAFIVDPVSVDELAPVARVSGSALVSRRSLSHALNSKAVARRFAREQRRPYEELRLIVAHLGSGISISAHQGGRMIDVNLAGQEGPMSTERCGSLQLLGVVDLCFSGRFTQRQLWDAFIREGGIYSYLGTKDLIEVERRIFQGDSKAALVFDAMVYQVSQQIGAMAAVLQGRLDAILFTGGMAHSEKLVADLRAAVGWIGPIFIYPGEDELKALAEGAFRVLRGEQQPMELSPESPTLKPAAAPAS